MIPFLENLFGNFLRIWRFAAGSFCGLFSLAILFVVFGGEIRAEMEIAVFGDESFVDLLEESDFEVCGIDRIELEQIDLKNPDILVIGPGKKVSPESRVSVDRYRKEGGNLVLLEPKAFAFPASLENPVSIVNFEESGSFRIRTSPIEGGKPKVELKETDWKDSRNGIRVETERVGEGDVFLEIPLREYRTKERNMLRFSAKGSEETGILSLSIRDRNGHRWIAFVESGMEWAEHEVRFADFVRANRKVEGDERLLSEEAEILEFGLVSRILWPESPASFSVADPVLGEGGEEAEIRSSEVSVWRDQIRARGGRVQEWFEDPFLGTSEIVTKENERFSAVPEPVSKRGRTHAPAGSKFESEEYQTRILAAVEEVSGERKTVGEWRRFQSGPFVGGSVVLLGIPEKLYWEEKWKTLLVEMLEKFSSPAVVRVTPLLSEKEGRHSLEILTAVFNPADEPFAGEISVRISDGSVFGKSDVRVEGNERKEIRILLSEVPEKIDWREIDFEVELRAEDRQVDFLRDSIEFPELLLGAARYLLKVQRGHRDGRFSHHFFSDQYSARFLFGFSRWLKKDGNAEALEVSRGEIEEFRDSAFRFAEMIVRRQRRDGSFPMGYLEHRDFAYVADLGQVSLGLVQIASWLEEGDERRNRYLETVRKYRNFRESFYQDRETVGKLEERFGSDSKNIRVGHYGLGLLDLDYFGDEKWGELRREERGPWWVLPVSMGFLGGLARLDSDPAVFENAERDLRFYLDAGYEIGAASHFHAESLFWMFEWTEDSNLRDRIRRKLEEELPKQLFRGKEFPEFEMQGRAALWPLSAVYARSLLEDRPEWRAVILAGLLRLGSENSSNSIENLSALYPRTTYGPSLAVNRYVGFSALWMLELLDPGSSLLKAD